MSFRPLKNQRLRRSDQVRWAPAWLAKHPALARRCDPTWAEITENGWLGFQNTRASDWDQYEFRREKKTRQTAAALDALLAGGCKCCAKQPPKT